MNRHKILMPHWPAPLWFEPPGNSLARTRALLERLGNPQEKLPPTVHVAGTNGKGSSIAFLRAMLEAAGYKVHSYTSPHMERFNEQISLAGQMIGDEPLHECLERCRMAAGDDLAVKFFEGTTAAAFLAMSRHPADILLLETGMGGRIDPTNVIRRPVLTLVTTISMDHTDFLGDSLRKIAGHKAGILKPGVPCVVSFQPPEAMEVLEEAATAVDVPLYVYGQHWNVQRAQEGIFYQDHYGLLPLPSPVLRGPHQLLNAGNAIAAASLLEDFDIPGEAIERGLRHAHWPGRLERFTGGQVASLLPEEWELWFDGGHNMAAGHAIAQHAQQEWQDKPLYLICGTTEGKDVAAMLLPLKDYVHKLYGVRVQAEPRSMEAMTVAAAASKAGYEPIVRDSVYEAVEELVSDKQNKPGRILVFGSLFFRIELR